VQAAPAQRGAGLGCSSFPHSPRAHTGGPARFAPGVSSLYSGQHWGLHHQSSSLYGYGPWCAAAETPSHPHLGVEGCMFGLDGRGKNRDVAGEMLGAEGRRFLGGRSEIYTNSKFRASCTKGSVNAPLTSVHLNPQWRCSTKHFI
jgi:hypothetical protein